jgi:hypothetical protein
MLTYSLTVRLKFGIQLHKFGRTLEIFLDLLVLKVYLLLVQPERRGLKEILVLRVQPARKELLAQLEQLVLQVPLVTPVLLVQPVLSVQPVLLEPLAHKEFKVQLAHKERSVQLVQ